MLLHCWTASHIVTQERSDLLKKLIDNINTFDEIKSYVISISGDAQLFPKSFGKTCVIEQDERKTQFEHLYEIFKTYSNDTLITNIIFMDDDDCLNFLPEQWKTKNCDGVQISDSDGKILYDISGLICSYEYIKKYFEMKYWMFCNPLEDIYFRKSVISNNCYVSKIPFVKRHIWANNENNGGRWTEFKPTVYIKYKKFKGYVEDLRNRIISSNFSIVLSGNTINVYSKLNLSYEIIGNCVKFVFSGELKEDCHVGVFNISDDVLYFEVYS